MVFSLGLVKLARLFREECSRAGQGANLQVGKYKLRVLLISSQVIDEKLLWLIALMYLGNHVTEPDGPCA